MSERRAGPRPKRRGRDRRPRWHRLQRGARGTRQPWRGLLVAGRGRRRRWSRWCWSCAGCSEVDGTTGDVRRGRGRRRAGRLHPRGPGRLAGGVLRRDARRTSRRGARVSVLSRGPHGARLRVEEGEARFEVVHRPHAAWSVEAGPYVVYVTGTAFDVRWSGADEVDRGAHAFRIGAGRGPLLPERVTLRAGQHLTAKLASGELHIGEARVGDVRVAAADGGAGAEPRPAARRRGRRRPRRPQPDACGRGGAAQRRAGLAPLRREQPAPAAPGRRRRPVAAGTRARRRRGRSPGRHRAPRAAHARIRSAGARAWSAAITSGNAARSSRRPRRTGWTGRCSRSKAPR